MLRILRPHVPFAKVAHGPANQNPERWIPAWARYCPECFLLIDRKPSWPLVACAMTALTIQF